MGGSSSSQPDSGLPRSATDSALAVDMDAMKNAKKMALQKGMETIESTTKDMMPGPLKCMVPCCGGPVETLKAFEFAVPADKKDTFKDAYQKYPDAKTELKGM